MWWIFHAEGQHPSRSKRRHIFAKGVAICLASRFRISAGIWSGPVAFETSRFFRRRNIWRDLRITMSSISMSGLPKKGQSIFSSENWDFSSNILANRFALLIESSTHWSPSFKGGILEIFIFFSRSSRFNFHHCLLPLSSFAILSFNFPNTSNILL